MKGRTLALLLATVSACAESKQAPVAPVRMFTGAAPVEVADEDTLVSRTHAVTWSAGYEATSNVPGTIQPEALRKDLDVATVVSLVRERLSTVAVLAVADTLKVVAADAERPWARDLLRLTAQLATARSADWRPVAEGALRVLARVLVADAVVRTSGADLSAPEQELLADWGYWYLAQIDLLRNPEVAPPECNGRPALCSTIRDAPAESGGSLEAIEQQLHITTILDGIRLAARLRSGHADSKLSATLLLEQLMNVKRLGSFQPVTDAINAFDTRLAEVKALEQKLVALDRARQYLQITISTMTAKSDEAKAAEVKEAAQQMLTRLQVSLPIDGKQVTVQEAIGRLGGDHAVEVYVELVDDLKAAAATGTNVRQLMVTMAANDVKVPPGIVRDVDQAATDLGQLKSLLAANSTLDKLALTNAIEIMALMNKVLVRLEHLDSLAALSPGLAAVLRDLRQQMQGIAVLLDRLKGLAELTASETLGKVHTAIRALRGVSNGKIVTPVLDLLAPVVDKLADGRHLTTGDLFAAISNVSPADLARALGSGFDIDQACKNERSWKCWSIRLAMSVNGSLRFDGKTVSVDSDAMLASVTKLGTETRKTEPGSLHILASVGTGTLYTESQWRPLIAEQLGASVVLTGTNRVTLSVGGFASGILYRFVLDDQVSKGVMAGGTVLLRLYDLVELHGDIATVIVPDDTSNSHFHLGLILGVQVPLGDYLERLRD
jgi:hypothetical protein